MQRVKFKSMASHNIYRGGELPEMEASHLEYWLAGNGLFVRAEREEFDLLWAISDEQVKGLPPLEEVFRNRMPVVPDNILYGIVKTAQLYANSGLEVLLYLFLRGGRWELERPDQEQSAGSCRPTDPAAGQDAVIEVHSHHDLACGARFSETDDEDETGFRIYGVLGHVSTAPEILVRVGVYGHFFEVAADTFFEMPAGLRCAL